MEVMCMFEIIICNEAKASYFCWREEMDVIPIVLLILMGLSIVFFLVEITSYQDLYKEEKYDKSRSQMELSNGLCCGDFYDGGLKSD